MAVNGDIYKEYPVEPTPPGVRKPHRFRSYTMDVDPATIDALPSEILDLIQELSLIGYGHNLVKPFYTCLTKNTTILDVNYAEVYRLDNFWSQIEACKLLKVVKISK